MLLTRLNNHDARIQAWSPTARTYLQYGDAFIASDPLLTAPFQPV